MSSIYGPRPVDWHPSPIKRPSKWGRFVAASKTKPALFGLAFAVLGTTTLLYSSAATGISGQITGLGKCLDVQDGNRYNGGVVQLWKCDKSGEQNWTINKDGSIANTSKWCLDVKDGSKVAHATVQLWKCSGGSSQHWVAQADSTILNPNSGLCLATKNGSSLNGARLWLTVCNANASQLWVVPKAKPASTPNPAPTSPASTTPSTTTPATPAQTTPAVNTSALDSPSKKEIAMELVSSAENSSLDWKAQYGYIEWNVEGVASENRGYTAGIIGFCSGCGDMSQLLQYYTKLQPSNVLNKYLPYVQRQEKLGMGKVTQDGLGQAFINDWKSAAKDPKFQQAQNDERDRVYFNPAVAQAKADGLHALGQFAYYDAMVVHGPGDDSMSFGGIRAAALKNAKTPAQGGDEKTYLNAFFDARDAVMKKEEAHADTSRVDTAQRVFLTNGNLNLNVPLTWKVYGDSYSITKAP